jgi:hypothetical protein
LSAGFFIYSSYNYFIYFFSNQADKLTTDSFLSSPRKVVTNLEVGAPSVFKIEERFDLAVLLKNPNDKFLANFNYCFKQGEQELDCKKNFILPGEEKYILALGQTIKNDQENVAFVIKDIFWQRINAHQIPNWSNFLAERLNFSFADINFATANNSGLSEKIGLNTLEFNINNLSPYSYYEVPLNILLYNGSELLGVHQYLLTRFLTGESRNVKISWPGNLTTVNRSEIKPDLNITESGVYLKYQGRQP